MTRDQIVAALDAPFVANLEANYGDKCDVLTVLARCLAINVKAPYVNLRGACTQAVKNEAARGVVTRTHHEGPPEPVQGAAVGRLPEIRAPWRTHDEPVNEAIAIRHVTQFVKVASSYKQFSPAELADEIEFGTNGFTPELARCIAQKLRKMPCWPGKKQPE